MKTWKKVVLGLIVLGVISIAACVAIEVSKSPKSIIPIESVEYKTKEELTDLYWQNKVVLNSVKNSVLSSKSLMQALDDYKEGDIDVSYKSDKKYFGDEEWVNIVSVFENLHPYMIMMERKGRPMKFYINFDDLKLDTGSKETSLYWFTDKKEIEYHKEHSLADSVAYTHLDGNWYIVEEIFPW